MTIFETTRRVLSAVLTALGVVFGLLPDPTRAPVPLPVGRDDARR